MARSKADRAADSAFDRADRATHHGVPDRYEDTFTPAVTSALIHYHRFVKRMSLDEAIREVDAMDKYLRDYK